MGEGFGWALRTLGNRVRGWSGEAKISQPWVEAYWPENFCAPRFHAPVVLFKNPKQPFFYIDDPLLGWGARSQGGVEVHEINANHHEVLREPHVQFVSEILLDRLHHKDARPGEPAMDATASNAPAAVTSY